MQRRRRQRGDNYVLSNMQNPDKNVTAWHDYILGYVQSAKAVGSHVVPYSYLPNDSPKKKITLNERAFGYRNIIFMNSGGTYKSVFTGGTNYWKKVPARLFYTTDFSLQIDEQWVFLNNGVTYVAWSPTQGSVETDPQADALVNVWTHGAFVKSTFKPTDAGEVIVLEVADANDYGSFGAFKNDILERNPNPSITGGKLTYEANDDAVVEYGPTYAKVNGTKFIGGSWPRASGNGLQNYTVSSGSKSITYNFKTNELTGDPSRLPRDTVFGVKDWTPPGMDGSNPPGPGCESCLEGETCEQGQCVPIECDQSGYGLKGNECLPACGKLKKLMGWDGAKCSQKPCGGADGETYDCDHCCEVPAACTLQTCASFGASCGAQSDGCGGTLNCGGCSGGQTCDQGQCAPNDCTMSGYNLKGNECLPACGKLRKLMGWDGAKCSQKPCSGVGGSSWDCNYCCEK